MIWLVIIAAVIAINVVWFTAGAAIESAAITVHDKLRWPAFIAGSILLPVMIMTTHDQPRGWQWAPALLSLVLLGQAFIP